MSVPICVSSLGELSRRLDEPLHRLEYIIRSRGIKPCLIAGGRHFYTEATTEQIRKELERIAEKRGGAQ
jgi:hypothetical protein